MFNNNHPQPLVHLTRAQPQPSDQLPRGECRFIFTEGTTKRCNCVCFTLNRTIPGSQCGCGHQAWNHVPEPAGKYVPVEEHVALLDRVKRSEDMVKRLHEELVREKKDREKEEQRMVALIRGNYINMAYLKYHVDERLEILRVHCEDKSEGVLDKAHSAVEDIEKLKSRLAEFDEAMMRLEERLDASSLTSRSISPAPENAMDTSVDVPSDPVPPQPVPLPIRTEDKYPDAWDVRVTLVPSRTQAFAFPHNSLAWRRCQSRGLQQDMHFQDKTAEAFVQCIEAGFAAILRGRPWMPLKCLRSENMSLGQLHAFQTSPALWNWRFMEEHCIASDKFQDCDIVYIALQEVDLSWDDISSLPRVFGSDESCWISESDSGPSTPRASTSDRMDYKMAGQNRHLKLDTDSVYEIPPPSYSSNSHRPFERSPSALGVLAAAAAISAPDVSRSPPETPHRSYSLVSLEDDEHRNKRTKRGALRPEPHPTGLHIPPPLSSASSISSGASSHHQPSSTVSTSPPQQQAYYFSGRSKRKITTPKPKEPFDWRVSELKLGNPVGRLMHRNPKDKAPQRDPADAPGSSHGQQV